jgi:hypothetical protein
MEKDKNSIFQTFLSNPKKTKEIVGRRKNI